MTEESLFLAALEKPTPAERQAFLDDACGEDVALRARVQMLLEADARVRGILDRPVPGDPEQTGAYLPNEQAGAVIAGRYKLLEAIGEGGMGAVWVAEQTQPVRRKVALKLIKAGMDSKSVLARFEAERQALAVMDHPSIAKVLDGGLTETGRPFFVMEYVKGVPITDYCDSTRLSVPERLNLFVQVCQAVQHAHQKGIIHRDLKPSNILVAPYDDRPVPKVIDFGLAKAMHGSLTERTLHTAHETVLGTPLYMSPEQANLNNLDVDTRSDIYSLGVLLYELLTGTTPLDKKRLKEAAWEEIKRVIREEEPRRPSARLSSTDTLPSLAAGRQIEPARLTKLVRGDLDWIVMKSLEKDRTRRYETANGFALDIQRYLTGEPVLAAPPSARYRLNKFLKRNKGPVVAASSVGVVLVVGIAGTTWGMFEAKRQENVARHETEEKEKARQAEAARADGERRAKLAAQAAQEKEARERSYAEAITQFVKDDFLALTSVEGQVRFGGEGLTRNATLHELLDRAATKLKERKNLAPRTEAELCWIIGVSYRGIGEAAKANPFLQRSLELQRQVSGPEAEATLGAQNSLAVAYATVGQYDRAKSLDEETVKLRKAKLGPDDPLTLMSMNNLAGYYMNLGKLDLAVPLYEETLRLSKAKMGADYPGTLDSMSDLAEAYRLTGKIDLALPLAEEALKRRKANLGAEHPRTLLSMNNLASAHQDAGRMDLALPLFEETLQLRIVRLGPDHPDTLVSRSNLAVAYWRQKQLDKSIPLFEELLKRFDAQLGRDHPSTLATMVNLGVNYNDSGRFKDAIPLLEEAYRAAKKYPLLRACATPLLDAYAKAGEDTKFTNLLQEQLTQVRQALPKDSPQLAGKLAQLGVSLLEQKKWVEAEPILRECLDIREKKEPGDWRTFNTKSALGAAMLGQKKYADAEPLLLTSYEGMKFREKTIPPLGKVRLPEALDRLIDLYTATNKPDDVKKWQAERAKYPKDTTKLPEKK